MHVIYRNGLYCRATPERKDLVFVSQLMALLRVGNYRATTSWRPWSAAIMVGVIIILSSLLSVLVLNMMSSGPVDPDGARNFGVQDLIILLLMQSAMVLLTLFAASAGPMSAGEVLALNRTNVGPRTYLAAIAVMFIWLAVYNGLVWLVAYDEWQADLFKFQDMIMSPDWWLFALVVVIGAPLSEEMLFRGFLQPALGQSSLGFMGAAFVSSMSWAALHWDYSISGLIEIFLIGLYLCGLLWVTGSLWVGIVCHGAYNLVLLLALRLWGGA